MSEKVTFHKVGLVLNLDDNRYVSATQCSDGTFRFGFANGVHHQLVRLSGEAVEAMMMLKQTLQSRHIGSENEA